MKTNTIKVPVCPICEQEEYYYSVCIKCDSRPRLQIIEREKKMIIGNYRIIEYVSTKTNAEIILQDIKTNEKYNVSLSQFFKIIKGLEYHDLTLQERKQGSAYTWEIIEEVK
jgi:hypothetical protein